LLRISNLLEHSSPRLGARLGRRPAAADCLGEKIRSRSWSARAATGAPHTVALQQLGDAQGRFAGGRRTKFFDVIGPIFPIGKMSAIDEQTPCHERPSSHA